MSDGAVSLTFPARAEYLILARLALAGVARAVTIDEETLADLKLAVTEACGNVVRHAYPDDVDGAGVIRVVLDVSGRTIAVSVEDDGVGFPDDASGASATGEERESGMGLAIIGAIADGLEVRRAGPAGGTVLSLRKEL